MLGTGAAWLTERTELPGRRVWSVLLIVPLVVPDFVLSWAWSSIFPSVQGYFGATLVMTLHLYPLVYLPMTAAFRAADPSQEEAARSLGLSRWAVWLRISVRQARSVLLGGCLLVSLSLMAYYGAFENLHYQTFTTAIFGELRTQFNPAGAASLSLVLVVLSLLVLGGETAFREQRPPAALRTDGPARPAADPAAAPDPARRRGRGGPAGRARAGIPGRHRLLLDGRGVSSALPDAVGLGSAAGYTALYSFMGALAATVLALPVALLATRHQRRWSTALERSTFLTQAIPGVVIGLALVFVASRYLGFLYQSPELLVASYTIMFFPLGLVAVTSSVVRASPRLEEAGRSLGRKPWAVRLDRHAPAAGSRPRRRVLLRLPLGGDRAHRHPAARADRRADPGDPVLGLRRAGCLVRRGGTVRGRDDLDVRSARLPARAMVRP